MDTALKPEFRERIIAARTAKTQSELDFASQEFAKHPWEKLITGQSVTCYASMGNEPGTEALRKALAGIGKTIYLPIIGPDKKMSWGLDRAPLVENIYGILEPEVSRFDLSSADAVILPALCVDNIGNRLGRGAGYFDRALADVPEFKAGGPLRIALVFDEEVLAHVPSDVHDAPVDLIVTPTRVIECTQTGS